MPGPDLFGFVPQIHASRMRRAVRVKRGASDDAQEKWASAIDAFSELREAIDTAVEDLRYRLCEIDDPEIALAIDLCDDELMAVIAHARDEVLG